MSFEKTLLERIASYIPGYGGYKQKEIRRETDALLRRHVASILASASAQLVLSPIEARAVAADAEARYLWDAVRAKLDKVIQKIDKAPHGYAGFFNIVKVNEEVLEAVYRHDLAMVESAKKIAESISSAKASRPLTQEWFQQLRNVLSQLEELDRHVEERNKLLRGIGEPPPPQWRGGKAR